MTKQNLRFVLTKRKLDNKRFPWEWTLTDTKTGDVRSVAFSANSKRAPKHITTLQAKLNTYMDEEVNKCAVKLYLLIQRDFKHLTIEQVVQVPHRLVEIIVHAIQETLDSKKEE